MARASFIRHCRQVFTRLSQPRRAEGTHGPRTLSPDIEPTKTQMGQTMHVIVFGNCQAQSIAGVISHHRLLRNHFSVHYVANFDTPGQERQQLSVEVLRETKILLEQATPLVRFDRRDDLSPNCDKVTFPSLDFNLLWPLNAPEKRNHPELPNYPFGRFPYGDRFINDVVDRGLRGRDAFDEYMRLSSEMLEKNLARLEQIERSRWQAIERDHDVKMADYLFGSFRRKRIFHTYNHPTRDTLCELIARILQAAFPTDAPDVLLGDVEALFTWDFGSDLQVPIHPVVAEKLRIEWWSPEACYNFRGAPLSHRDFIQKQIDWA